MVIRILHFFYKRLNSVWSKVLRKPANANFSKAVKTNEEANRLIRELIEKKEPLFIGRFGAVELACVMNYLSFTEAKKGFFKKLVLQAKQGKDGYWKGWSDGVRLEMGRNAGFFPTSDEMLTSFAEMMLTQMKQLDVLGVWNLYGEDELQKEYFANAALIPLESIEPYYHANPWSKALKGKKVLVIHPFTESIKANYKNRDKLFKDEVLPKFELKTIKAVQSIANNSTGFKSWFEAFDDMCRQIKATDFDIAIIGAGAYGFPLAAFIKDIGKQAIHIGGPTQVLFGIRGSRWDNREFFQGLYNEYWTRPLPSEIPGNFETVEKGCYW